MKLIFYFFLASVGSAVSCAQGNALKAKHQSALLSQSANKIAAAHFAATAVPLVKLFRLVFPNSVVLISDLNAKEGEPRVWLQAAIENRYVLSAWLPVVFSSDFRRVISVRPIENVEVEEYAKIENLPTGQVRIMFAPPTRRLSSAQFERLLKARGDVSTLGIVLNHRAVSGFADYWNTHVRPIEEKQKNGMVDTN